LVAILFSTIYPQINLSDFVQRHQELAQPVQTVILNWKAPAENFVKPLNQPDYWQWVSMVFWAGVALLAGRLMMQLFSLYKLYRQSKPGHVHDYPVRLIRDNISPFSFWKSIYINPDNLSAADLKSVLEHEHVHVSEWHTLDIILAELSTIFYWFNPGVWLMKKAVRENIEFITDRKILKKGVDSKQYQYSLVNVGFSNSPHTIVNHFNISTIKKRIIMMNAKRSAGYNITRYLFLVPAVVALLLVFSLSKAAITKNSLPKAIATVVSNMNILDKPIISPTKTIAAKHIVQKSHLKNADTIYAGSAKTKNGKNKNFMITSDQKADSINYVINGIKSTKADLKAMDPARIKSLELVPGDKAKEFINGLDNDHQTLFVTTDDSEAGKKLKEKIDNALGYGKLAGGRDVVARGYSSSASGNGVSNGPAITVYGNDSNDNAPMAAASSSVSVSSSSDDNDAAPMVLSSTINGVNTSVDVVTDPKIHVKGLTKLNSNMTIKVQKGMNVSIDPQSAVVVSSDDMAPQVVELRGLNTIRPDNARAYTYSVNGPRARAYRLSGISDDHVSSIDDVSDKLIIINGKKASDKDMKALKITDIKSMTEKTDKATKEKYGDKAKNGVLFITTKK